MLEGLLPYARRELEAAGWSVVAEHADGLTVRAAGPDALLALRLASAVYRRLHFDVPRPKALLGDQHFRRLLAAVREVDRARALPGLPLRRGRRRFRGVPQAGAGPAGRHRPALRRRRGRAALAGAARAGRARLGGAGAVDAQAPVGAVLARVQPCWWSQRDAGRRDGGRVAAAPRRPLPEPHVRLRHAAGRALPGRAAPPSSRAWTWTPRRWRARAPTWRLQARPRPAAWCTPTSARRRWNPARTT